MFEFYALTNFQNLNRPSKLFRLGYRKPAIW